MMKRKVYLSSKAARRKKIFRRRRIFTAVVTFSIIFGIYKLINLKGNDDVATLGSNIKKNAKEIKSSEYIKFTENEYFKKYIIECEGIVENISQENSGEDLKVTIDDSSVKKIENAEYGKFKDMYIKKNKDDIQIKIKKLHDKENYGYIDKKDKRKVVILMSKKENPYKYKVTIDPGHGGEDPGANVNGLYEKDITLKIAQYMLNNLKYNGIRVKLTRVDDNVKDSNIPNKRLKEVCDIANDFKSDIFVSIHVNSNENSNYKGVSTYYYTKKTGFQKEEREKLAQTIQDEMLKKDDWKDMKIFDNNLMVLRDTEMPSALVECGFMSNAENRAKLKKEKVVQNFADNIANGIIKYLNN